MFGYLNLCIQNNSLFSFTETKHKIVRGSLGHTELQQHTSMLHWLNNNNMTNPWKTLNTRLRNYVWNNYKSVAKWHCVVHKWCHAIFDLNILHFNAFQLYYNTHTQSNKNLFDYDLQAKYASDAIVDACIDESSFSQILRVDEGDGPTPKSS